MLEVVREEGETIDRLLRRYNDKLRRVNFIGQVKSRGFFSRPINRRVRKKTALYNIQKREQMDYLKRIGKIEERNFYYTNNRNNSSRSNRS